MSYTCMLQKRFRDRTIRLCNVGSGSNVTVCLVCSDDFFRRHDRVNIVPLRFFVCQINSGTTVLYIMEETDDSFFMSLGCSFCKIRLFLLYVTGASLGFFHLQVYKSIRYTHRSQLFHHRFSTKV